MRLSILIPIYNQSVERLVTALTSEIALKKYADSIEIIIIDDASTIPILSSVNRDYLIQASFPFVAYHELHQNTGRAAVRNQLADMAEGEYLVFMDGDAFPLATDFVEKYLNAAASGSADIYVGGTAYQPEVPALPYYLHWLVGTRREAPSRAFKTFNFCIRRKAFMAVRFDESFVGYGHEDTFFGMQLHAQGYRFEYIDNPLIHEGLEETLVFLSKQTRAIENALIHIDKLRGEIKLLRVYERLGRFAWLILDCLVYAEPCLRWHLAGGRVKLWVFDIWKLIVLRRAIKKARP